MPAEVNTTQVRVSWPVKRRLERMQEEMTTRLGRQVTISEVLEALLAEHDKAMEANPI